MCEGERAGAPPVAQRMAVREVEEDEDTTFPSTTFSTTVTVRLVVVVVDELRTNQRAAHSKVMKRAPTKGHWCSSKLWPGGHMRPVKLFILHLNRS